MQNQNTTKKPYTPPTVTEHGNAVQSTKGFGGKYFEMMSTKPEPEDIIRND
jgi:hypothetical protein